MKRKQLIGILALLMVLLACCFAFRFTNQAAAPGETVTAAETAASAYDPGEGRP